LTPLKINGWNMSSWRWMEDDVLDSKWVMGVGSES